MVNSEAFIGRLEKIMEHYDLTAAAFADRIGVQRSGISHLLSGRNKPSLDFVLKVISSFPEVNLYWLLNGKGSFPPPPDTAPESGSQAPAKSAQARSMSSHKPIARVLILYEDGSFESYEKGELKK